jgi:hypothetical protein
MRTKEVKFPLTPITEETFIRQGWRKCDVNEPLFEELGEGLDDFFDEMEDDEIEEPEEPMEKPEAIAWYYTLALPKDRNDPYCPRLVSNATDESGLLKEMGLPEGTFFVELMDWDGLGYCQSEEEIEILYKALTGTNLENKKKNRIFVL